MSHRPHMLLTEQSGENKTPVSYLLQIDELVIFQELCVKVHTHKIWWHTLESIPKFGNQSQTSSNALVPNSWMFHHSQRGCWEKLSRALLTKVTWKLCRALGSTQNDHHNLKTFSPWNKTLLSNSVFIYLTCSSKQMWAVSFLVTQNKVKSRNTSVSERSQICSEKQQS